MFTVFISASRRHCQRQWDPDAGGMGRRRRGPLEGQLTVARIAPEADRVVHEFVVDHFSIIVEAGDGAAAVRKILTAVVRR